MIYSRALKGDFGSSILNVFGKQLLKRGAQKYALGDAELELLEIVGVAETQATGPFRPHHWHHSHGPPGKRHNQRTTAYPPPFKGFLGWCRHRRRAHDAI